MLADARRLIEPRPGPVQAVSDVECGALLVDVRSVDERERHGVIPGSLHVPLGVLQWRADPSSGWTSPYLGDLSRRLVLVCAEGYSSSLAAASLVELGYPNATDLDGGFAAWRDAGLPVVPAPPTGLDNAAELDYDVRDGRRGDFHEAWNAGTAAPPPSVTQRAPRFAGRSAVTLGGVACAGARCDRGQPRHNR